MRVLQGVNVSGAWILCGIAEKLCARMRLGHESLTREPGAHRVTGELAPHRAGDQATCGASQEPRGDQEPVKLTEKVTSDDSSAPSEKNRQPLIFATVQLFTLASLIVSSSTSTPVTRPCGLIVIV